jgi:hypothetical protein
MVEHDESRMWILNDIIAAKRNAQLVRAFNKFKYVQPK